MGQAAVKKTGKKNALAGFVVDLVNGEVMRAFVRGNGLKKVDTDITDEQLGVTLTMHFRETTPEDDLCECDVCSGVAPDALKTCPYCGVEGEAEEEEPKTGKTQRPAGHPAASEDAAEDAEEEDEEEDDEDEDEEEDEEEDGDDEEEDEEEETPALKTKAPKKGAATKKASKKMTASTAMTVNGKGKTDLSKFSVKDLDKSVKEAIALKRAGFQACWDLGRKILEINENHLWKLRTDDEGKARYSGFDGFVHSELGMTPSNAYQSMAWARTYTAEDIGAMGVSKAALIMKAPPEDRAALALAAKRGASKREIAKKVKDAKKKRNYEGATPQAKRGSKGAKTRATKLEKKAASDRVTIAKIEGKKTISLYAKPATLRNLNMKDLKQAKSLKDIPFGRLELANEVVQYFSVQVTKTGNIVLVIDTRREVAE